MEGLVVELPFAHTIEMYSSRLIVFPFIELPLVPTPAIPAISVWLLETVALIMDETGLKSGFSAPHSKQSASPVLT